MLFWIIAATATAVACAALYFASAGRRVNAGDAASPGPGQESFRERLVQIDRDLAEGRMAEADAVAAKAELAREVLREQQDRAAAKARAPRPAGRVVVLASSLAVALLAFTVYATLGQPDLPAQPLLARADLPGNMTLEQAVAQIEQQMAKTPDDVRGWQALGPAYLQLGRLDDAVKAYRRVSELSPPTAKTQGDLAEVLMMAQGGQASGEALKLFQSAAALDPTAARPRFYLASEATRTGNYAEAVSRWKELLALSKGGETWLPAAQRGLELASAGLSRSGPAQAAGARPASGGGGLSIELQPGQDGPQATATEPGPRAPETAESSPASQDAQIRGMVEGLQSRLSTQGGSVEEWTRLVRSWLVLGESDKAKAAYGAAVAAYPDVAVRGELDSMARDAGIVLADKGATP